MRQMAHLSGGRPEAPAAEDVRLAELVASLSLATDLGNGQPPETALQCTLVALRLADATGATGDADRGTVFWAGLLRFVGCVATSVEESRFGGDDLALRRGLLASDFGSAAEIQARVHSSLVEALGPHRAGRETRRFLTDGPPLAPVVFASHCEVATRLATRLGMPAEVIDAVNALHECWDGHGVYGLAGDAIPLAARVLKAAEVALVYSRLLPRERVGEALLSRAGRDLDPQLVSTLAAAPAILGSLDGTSVWDEVLAHEPRPSRRVPPEHLVELAHVLADYSDLKSPFTLGHARGVAALASTAAEALGLPSERQSDLEMAALLHDLGRASIPSGLLDSPRPLNAVDRERARRHSYESERILTFVPALARVARLAGEAHERLDGSGYHRGLEAGGLSVEARILTAANAYRGLIEGRAYRSALSPESAASKLRAVAAAGSLDLEAVEAVLLAAGDRQASPRAALPAGLTARELEVLRLLARGLTNPQIGEALTISPRTAQQHVKHIYEKIGVSTRAAAALFAAEHDLFASWRTGGRTR